jgi:uncharacterized LabA/DUF88 family protein
MKKASSRSNNYAFIDSQNLNLAIREQSWRLSYKKFRRYLTEKYNITKAFMFIGYLPKYKGFYRILRNLGYILIFKPTLFLPDGKTKGNVDAELVLHTMIEYPNYKKAVIISNDGDFYCLVKYLLSKGKLLNLMIPNKEKYSFLLDKFKKNIVYMNGLKDKLEY